MKPIFIKRRYFDLRLGSLTINPIIQGVNFVMLAYLSFNDILPFWIFAPLLFVSLAGLFVLVGNRFRNMQYSTDADMLYEKSIEQAKTNLILLKAIKRSFLTTDPDYQALEERIQYLQKIIDKKL